MDIEGIQTMYFDFFSKFRAGKNFTYVKKIDKMSVNRDTSLIIDCSDLHLFDNLMKSNLHQKLLEKTNFSIDAAASALSKFIKSKNSSFYEEVSKSSTFFARFINLSFSNSIEQIVSSKSSMLNTYLHFTGIIVKSSLVHQLMTEAFYVCDTDFMHIQIIKEKELRAPRSCPVKNCSSKSFALDERSSKFTNYQNITIQEIPEDLKPSSSPNSISCRLLFDLPGTCHLVIK